MKRRLEIQWVLQRGFNPELVVLPSLLGYDTHIKNIRRYCQKIMDFDANAYIALTIIPVEGFNPIPAKFNILFTTWEYPDLAESVIEGINKADAIVVPSRFCRDLFAQHTNKPVEVCWEGVEPGVYKYYERRLPDLRKRERFRLLWVGAPNPRKGYSNLLEIIKFVEQRPGIELYIKTVAPRINCIKAASKINWLQTKKQEELISQHWEIEAYSYERKYFLTMLRQLTDSQVAGKVSVFGRFKNIIVDIRYLRLNKLVHLYHQAHCFIFPTFGEGFGLPLCEAMATGCPCIATAVTGAVDFFDENVGFPIKYGIREQEVKQYGLKTKEFVPDSKDFIEKITLVMENYREALKKGKIASERIRKKFTWEKSASRLEKLIWRFTNIHT